MSPVLFKLDVLLVYCSVVTLAPQLESNLSSPQLEKRPHSNKDPAQPKLNKINIYFFKLEVLLFHFSSCGPFHFSWSVFL